MAGKPDFKIMVTEKATNGTYYKQVGVAWKGTTKDGREKVNLKLFMFPNLDLNCFINDDEPKRAEQRPLTPQQITDDDIPF